MEDNPSEFKDVSDDCPVENVSWEECQGFIKRLNLMEGTGSYRLPTEAEWEYACRAGSTTCFCFGISESGLNAYAWYDKNSKGRTHPVGRKKPSAWGLYDMHGNVWEWCQDWYGDYPSGSVTNPIGPSSGSNRVVRGGSWLNPASGCRAANRAVNSPERGCNYIGFRLLRESK